MRIPERISLVQQVAGILRDQLHEGAWPNHLPGELALSDELQVSRSTLRLAFEILEEEGLLRVSQGRRRSALPAARRSHRKPTKSIAMILGSSLQEQMARALIIVDELRRYLQQRGFTLTLYSEPRQQSSRREFHQLIAQDQADCWILSSCSAEMQQWFVERRRPTVLFGSPHKNIDLPAVRCDAAAACRHALGALYAKGHRRIALVLREPLSAGSIEVEEAFHAVSPQFPDLATMVRRHDGSSEVMDRIFNSLLITHRRTTALITMTPTDALTAYCYFIHRYVKIPSQMSLISLFDDLFVSAMKPEFTRYRFNAANCAKSLARLVVRAKTHSQLRSISITPDFLPGGTLERPQSPMRTSE